MPTSQQSGLRLLRRFAHAADRQNAAFQGRNERAKAGFFDVNQVRIEKK
jgi:hypothetical protein